LKNLGSRYKQQKVAINHGAKANNRRIVRNVQMPYKTHSSFRATYGPTNYARHRSNSRPWKKFRVYRTHSAPQPNRRYRWATKSHQYHGMRPSTIRRPYALRGNSRPVRSVAVRGSHYGGRYNGQPIRTSYGKPYTRMSRYA